MIGKEGHGERWMDDSVTLAVRVMCESTTMTDREGEVHALSADHEVVHNGIKVGVEVGCRVGVVVRRMKWAELNVVVGKLYQHSFQYILLSTATDRRETRNE